MSCVKPYMSTYYTLILLNSVYGCVCDCVHVCICASDGERSASHSYLVQPKQTVNQLHVEVAEQSSHQHWTESNVNEQQHDQTILCRLHDTNAAMVSSKTRALSEYSF